MNTCTRCETLPPPVPQKGVCYMAAPMAPLREELRELLAQCGMQPGRIEPNMLAASFEQEQMQAFCDSCHNMGAEVLEETRVLLTENGETPDFAMLFRMEHLSSLVARVRNQWLLRLLQEERVTTHFQPIIHSRAPSEVFAYECLLRGVGAEGEVIAPGKLFSVAREANLLFFLDRIARISALRCADAAGITEKIFINFNPTSIYKPEYCLRSTFAALQQTALRHEQVVFELVESEHIRDVAHVAELFAYYKRHGFQVALDDVGTGFSSLEVLATVQPDYVKADMVLVRDVDSDPVKAVILENLLRMARQLGMQLIAEGVETAAEFDWVRERGADFCQGFHFARPAAGRQRLEPEGS